MSTTRQEHPASAAPLDEAGLRDLILEILDENHVMCVATVRSDGWPHATLVNYLRLGRALYFVVARDSQKFENITRDSRVSIARGGGLLANGAGRGLSMAALAIACRRCVLPRPTPAWMNSGFKRTAPAPASAIVFAAASATRLDEPSTKVSKVKRVSSGEPNNGPEPP